MTEHTIQVKLSETKKEKPDVANLNLEVLYGSYVYRGLYRRRRVDQQ